MIEGVDFEDLGKPGTELSGARLRFWSVGYLEKDGGRLANRRNG